MHTFFIIPCDLCDLVVFKEPFFLSILPLSLACRQKFMVGGAKQAELDYRGGLDTQYAKLCSLPRGSGA